MRRYLVVANQTLATEQLRQELLLRAEEGESLFHFLVPNTEEQHYSDDWSGADSRVGTEGARERLKHALQIVRDAGAAALGALGDPDPLQAVELQMQCSVYDEVIVSMLPEKTSRWYRQDIPSRIENAIETGHIRPDVDPGTEAAVFVSMIRGAANQWMLDPECFDLDEIAARTKAMLRRNLAARPERSARTAPMLRARTDSRPTRSAWCVHRRTRR